MSFETLIPDAKAFLGDLAANNTRDWFTTHKPDYERDLKTPATFLLAEMATRLGRLSGQPVRTKLFRPHRDLRFSKDKTPYHTHLHLLWQADDGGQWFFGVSPDYVTAGAGRMGFDKAQLATYRAALSSHGPALKSEIDALTSQGAHQWDPELKRPAAPIPPGDPLADLARRKSLTVWFDLPDTLPDLPAQLETTFTRLWPLQRILDAVLAD